MTIKARDLKYVLDPYLDITIAYLNPIENLFDEKNFRNIEVLARQHPRLNVTAIYPKSNGNGYYLRTDYPIYEIPDIATVYVKYTTNIIDDEKIFKIYKMHISKRTINYLILSEKVTVVERYNNGKCVSKHYQMNI